jgi:uncharacterized phage infection (PIP) family protein YhgE
MSDYYAFIMSNPLVILGIAAIIAVTSGLSLIFLMEIIKMVSRR